MCDQTVIWLKKNMTEQSFGKKSPFPVFALRLKKCGLTVVRCYGRKKNQRFQRNPLLRGFVYLAQKNPGVLDHGAL